MVSQLVAFAASYVASSVQFFALSDTKLVEPIDLEGEADRIQARGRYLVNPERFHRQET